MHTIEPARAGNYTRASGPCCLHVQSAREAPPRHSGVQSRFALQQGQLFPAHLLPGEQPLQAPFGPLTFFGRSGASSTRRKTKAFTAAWSSSIKRERFAYLKYPPKRGLELECSRTSSTLEDASAEREMRVDPARVRAAFQTLPAVRANLRNPEGVNNTDSLSCGGPLKKVNQEDGFKA